MAAPRLMAVLAHPDDESNGGRVRETDLFEGICR
jgi:LmbE family N-acetylglucosaminyl deacetylase